MLSASSTSKRLYCQTSIHPCVGKRRTYNLHRSSVYIAFSGQPRRTFDPADPSRLATPLDLPTFATDFEPSSLANLPSFRKTLSNDSIIGTILVRGVEVIGCTQSCDRSSSLRGVTERSNVSLAFSPSSSSSFSFLSRLEAASSRDCFFIEHETVNNLLQRFDNRLKIPVQCCPFRFYRSFLRARCFLQIDSLVFSISLTIFSRSRTSAMCVSGEVSTMTSHGIANSLNLYLLFLYFPCIFKRCPCLSLKIHIFFANSRDITNKIHRTT